MEERMFSWGRTGKVAVLHLHMFTDARDFFNRKPANHRDFWSGLSCCNAFSDAAMASQAGIKIAPASAKRPRGGLVRMMNPTITTA